MVDSELEKYMLYEKREIVRALNELASHRVSILMSMDASQDKCLTSIISADFEEGFAYLDVGVDEIFNNKLPDAKVIYLNLDHGIRVRCAMKDPKLVDLKDGKAIRVSLPDSLLKLQRREFCRFPVALTRNVLCEIPVKTQLAESPTDIEVIAFQVSNASLGGIGAYLNIEKASTELESVFILGAEFENCCLHLESTSKLNLSLRIRHFKSIVTTNNLIKYIIGFDFIGPSRTMQSSIHKFVFAIEHEFVLKHVQEEKIYEKRGEDRRRKARRRSDAVYTLMKYLLFAIIVGLLSRYLKLQFLTGQ